jgi:hypothetical protein
MCRQGLLTAAILLSWCPTTRAGPFEFPPSFVPGAIDRADIVVKSVRLTDNGDNDGFADPNETVSLFVTLRNSSGADRDGIVVTVTTTDATVDCISSPALAFGTLLAGEERESAVPAVFRVADVARSDALESLTATFDLQITGNDFGGTVRPQQAVLDLDLNVSGGLLPTTFTEGFEGAGFGSFTSMSLDTNRASLAASDGFRCQYNDPDFVNSNSYGNTFCYLGFPLASDNGYDWHVHGIGSPDGGRAYLGNSALHWGVHLGAASADTTRLKQLDAVRTNTTINLGWNGVTSMLTFKQQVGLVDCDYVECQHGFTVDRGIVQVQLANSAGQAVGNWRKIAPNENTYDSQTLDNFSNCTFDPTDDGSTEDDYFNPSHAFRRLGPSSTCAQEFAFSRQGAIFWSDTFDPADIHHASDGPGLQGSLGPGTWVESKFDLSRFRGRRLRLRFLVTSIEITGGTLDNVNTWQRAFGWNPKPADDGWYIDDLRVTNTLTGAATMSVDQADRTDLPTCGPVCGTLTASLTATPPTVEPNEEVTLDGSGSAADQCPGGTLRFRFWDDVEKDGVLGQRDTVLQEWGENAAVTDTPNRTKHYFMDVRCPTGPACASRVLVVVPLVCAPIARVPFPDPIVWESKTHVVFGNSFDVSADAIRGDLGALRASQGQFHGTVLDCMVNNVHATGSTNLNFTHEGTPSPGQAFYYLVKDDGHTCASWGTGSTAEVPGAGGDRDSDIPLDPNICPANY